VTPVLYQIRSLLRWDDGPEGRACTCENCGYAGPFATASCACYDEYAIYCRPDSRGPGCPNGAPYCPVCQDGNDTPDDKNIAKALMLVEKLLGEVDGSNP